MPFVDDELLDDDSDPVHPEHEQEWGYGGDELDDDGMGYAEDDADEDEDDAGECGLFLADGVVYMCGAVGSEDCEFDCPYNYLIGTRAELVE